MTIKEMLSTGADALRKSGIAEFRTDAWYLLSYYVNIERNEYYKNPDRIVSDRERKGYAGLIRERAERKPLQYITGEQEFMGLPFTVNENVLIPRQDTEVLCESAIKLADGRRVLDMCTGSGCIAVSIARYSNAVSVTASDVSQKAVEVARKNAERNGTDIEFVISDIWEDISGRYDMVVSNPPYISKSEMEGLMPEVARYEPALALYGGEDGLDYYRRILSGTEGRLSPGGVILLEIGCTQADQVSRLLECYGFTEIAIKKDLAGLDRVACGYLK